jgi:hypothetical protein
METASPQKLQETIDSLVQKLTQHGIAYEDTNLSDRKQAQCNSCQSVCQPIQCLGCQTNVGWACCTDCCEACAPEMGHPTNCPRCYTTLMSTACCVTRKQNWLGKDCCPSAPACTHCRPGTVCTPQGPCPRDHLHIGPCPSRLTHANIAPHVLDTMASLQNSILNSPVEGSVKTLGLVRALMAAGQAHGSIPDMLSLWHRTAVGERQPLQKRETGPKVAARVLAERFVLAPHGTRTVGMNVPLHFAQPDNTVWTKVAQDVNYCVPWVLRVPERVGMTSHPIPPEQVRQLCPHWETVDGHQSSDPGYTWTKPQLMHVAGAAIQPLVTSTQGMPRMFATVASPGVPDQLVFGRRRGLIRSYLAAVIWGYVQGEAALAARLHFWDQEETNNPVRTCMYNLLDTPDNPSFVRLQKAMRAFECMVGPKPGDSPCPHGHDWDSDPPLPPRPEWSDFFPGADDGPGNGRYAGVGGNVLRALLILVGARWVKTAVTQESLDPAECARLLSGMLDLSERQEWCPRGSTTSSRVRGMPCPQAITHMDPQAQAPGMVTPQDSETTCRHAGIAILGNLAPEDCFPSITPSTDKVAQLHPDHKAFHHALRARLLGLARTEGFPGATIPACLGFPETTARVAPGADEGKSEGSALLGLWHVDDHATMQHFRFQTGISHYDEAATPLVDVKMARLYHEAAREIGVRRGHRPGLQTWQLSQLVSTQMDTMVLRHAPAHVVNLAMALLATVAMHNSHQQGQESGVALEDNLLLFDETGNMVQGSRARLDRYGRFPPWAYTIDGHQFLRAACNSLTGTSMRTLFPQAAGQPDSGVEQGDHSAFGDLMASVGTVTVEDLCAVWTQVQTCRQTAAHCGPRIMELYRDRFHVAPVCHPRNALGSDQQCHLRMQCRHVGFDAFEKSTAPTPWDADTTAQVRRYMQPASANTTTTTQVQAGGGLSQDGPAAWELPPCSNEQRDWEEHFQARWDVRTPDQVCPANVALQFLSRVCVHFCLRETKDTLMLTLNSTVSYDLMTQVMGTQSHDTMMNTNKLWMHLYEDQGTGLTSNHQVVAAPVITPVHHPLRVFVQASPIARG